MAEDNGDKLRELVAQVAAAYFASSHVNVSEIPVVVDQIAKSLGAVGSAQPAASAEGPAPTAAVSRAQIRKSITPDAIVSFEDGKRYKTLRRHLSVKGLTPDQYREKWGLPKDYPMVAPGYSEARSKLAKALGLGNRGGGRQVTPPAESKPNGRRRRAATE